MKVETSIDIDAPPERVWEVLMDPDRLADWVTIHRSIGGVSDRPLEQDSTLKQKLCLRGVSFNVRWTVTDLHEHERATWRGKGPALSSAVIRYQLTPGANGGTHFDYLNEFKAPGGPLGAVVGRVLTGDLPRREADASIRRLKALIERDAAERS